MDVSYLNIAGTFYFLCCILDGYSRFIVHWEIREKMEEIDVETILQRARECHPGVTPRIISDNGPQFIAKDFKEFIRIAGMTHVRTSPYYPQSNGKIERWHKTLKGDCIRVKVPLSPEDARRIVADYVQYYNHVRLHSAVGYVTPNDRLLGNDEAIHAERDRKLAEARERRKAAAANPARRTADQRGVPSRHRLRRRACRHHHCSGAGLARLRAPLRSRRPATRRLSLPRLQPTNGPLLQRQHPSPQLPLFQVQSLRQRPGPVGPGPAPIDLRCRHRPVPTPQHPRAPADTTHNPGNQRRGNRSHLIKHLYNHESVQRSLSLPANPNLAIFLFRLNQYKAEEQSETDLQQRLAMEAELVPCPECNWINDELVKGYRLGRYRAIGTFAWAIGFAGSALSLVAAWFIHIGPPVDRWMLPYLLFAGPGAFASMTMAMLFFRAWLRNRIQPNREFPQEPQLPYGTPPPLVLDKATQELRLANPAAAPVDGALDFQVGRHVLPALCCECLQVSAPRPWISD